MFVKYSPANFANVLHTFIAITYGNFARNIPEYTKKFVKFAELYFPHFATFRDQTLQLY